MLVVAVVVAVVDADVVQEPLAGVGEHCVHNMENSGGPVRGIYEFYARSQAATARCASSP